MHINYIENIDGIVTISSFYNKVYDFDSNRHLYFIYTVTEFNKGIFIFLSENTSKVKLIGLDYEIKNKDRKSLYKLVSSSTANIDYYNGTYILDSDSHSSIKTIIGYFYYNNSSNYFFKIYIGYELKLSNNPNIIKTEEFNKPKYYFINRKNINKFINGNLFMMIYRNPNRKVTLSSIIKRITNIKLQQEEQNGNSSMVINLSYIDKFLYFEVRNQNLYYIYSKVISENDTVLVKDIQNFSYTVMNHNNHKIIIEKLKDSSNNTYFIYCNDLYSLYSLHSNNKKIKITNHFLLYNTFIELLYQRKGETSLSYLHVGSIIKLTNALKLVKIHISHSNSIYCIQLDNLDNPTTINVNLKDGQYNYIFNLHTNNDISIRINYNIKIKKKSQNQYFILSSFEDKKELKFVNINEIIFTNEKGKLLSDSYMTIIIETVLNDYKTNIPKFIKNKENKKSSHVYIEIDTSKQMLYVIPIKSCDCLLTNTIRLSSSTNYIFSYSTQLRKLVDGSLSYLEQTQILTTDNLVYTFLSNEVNESNLFFVLIINPSSNSTTEKKIICKLEYNYYISNRKSICCLCLYLY